MYHNRARVSCVIRARARDCRRFERGYDKKVSSVFAARKPPSQEKMKKLESLRSRPRRRPDWSDMMKEVEDGKKLKHVECNDRSAPIINVTKSQGQVKWSSPYVSFQAGGGDRVGYGLLDLDVVDETAK